MAAITTATVLAGLSKAPAYISQVRDFLRLFRGGNVKEEAAKDIAKLVERSSRRLDTAVEVAELFRESIDPASAMLLRSLHDEARADHEDYMEIANRLSDKAIVLPGESEEGQ